jgi:hypothetical protein
MIDESPVYDVAISFLSRDADYAVRLAEKLAPFKVFCFPRSQEDVAGTDGMDKFRAAFRSESRIQVVLFRPGWGETPWTRIEQTAIQERCLQHGWRGLFFAMLEGGKAPAWVPEKEIYIDLAIYSMDEAVGAIKARAQELGSVPRVETALDRAKRAQAAVTFERETRELFSSHQGVNLAREQATNVCSRLENETQAAAEELRIDLRLVRPLPFNFAWTTPSAGATLLFKCAVNAVDRDACLEVCHYAHEIVLPGENRYYVNPGMPKMHSRHRYKIARSMELGMCWRNRGRLVSSDALGEAILRDFWGVYEDANTRPLDLD